MIDTSTTALFLLRARLLLSLSYSLPKNRVELLRDVILLIPDICFSQLDDNVRISLSIKVSRVKVRCLKGKICTAQ